MGASWSQVLQGLLVGLAVQIVASVLLILCASLWASMKERMSRPGSPPAGGENITEPDLEMGTMNGSEVEQVVDPGHDAVLLGIRSTSSASSSDVAEIAPLQVVHGTTSPTELAPV